MMVSSGVQIGNIGKIQAWMCSKCMRQSVFQGVQKTVIRLELCLEVCLIVKILLQSSCVLVSVWIIF